MKDFDRIRSRHQHLQIGGGFLTTGDADGGSEAARVAELYQTEAIALRDQAHRLGIDRDRRGSLIVCQGCGIEVAIADLKISQLHTGLHVACCG